LRFRLACVLSLAIPVTTPATPTTTVARLGIALLVAALLVAALLVAALLLLALTLLALTLLTALVLLLTTLLLTTLLLTTLLLLTALLLITLLLLLALPLITLLVTLLPGGLTTAIRAGSGALGSTTGRCIGAVVGIVGGGTVAGRPRRTAAIERCLVTGRRSVGRRSVG